MMATIIQADIDAILERIQVQRQQIEVVRESLMPLEDNLIETYDAFQVAVGDVRRQSMRLQSEIANLRAQIDSFNQDQIDDDEIDQSSFMDDFNVALEDTVVDPEAVEKDVLLAHLCMVLDHMTNDDDAELFGNLQGLCQDPDIRLIDVLDEIPWGPIWTKRNRQEALADQHQRLTSWEKALKQQLDSLSRATERLKKDSRYGLWQQRQKGPDAWQTFLAQYAEQLSDQNAELETELASLRQEWAILTESRGG